MRAGAGISSVRPAALRAATLAAIGARPLPFIATVGLPAWAYSTKQSPPMPVIAGSTTQLRRHRRQSGIHGIATCLQNLEPGCGGERVRGGDGGIAREKRRALGA